MTIAEKSTELGIDLAQLAVDATTYQVHEDENEVFQHFCANKEGNIYLKDDSDKRVHNGYFIYISEGLEETATIAEIKADFKAIIDATEYIEMPAAKVYVDLI